MFITFNIWTDLLMLISFIFVIIYLYFIHLYGYWKRKGVYSPKPTIFVGHLGKSVLGEEHMGVRMANLYHKTKMKPFIGLYMFHAKTIMFNDLNLIKSIMVRDFQYFTDHGIGVSKTNDPLWYNLFTMEGTEWKYLRAKLTPTFTTSKMKYMFDNMLECSTVMQKYLVNVAKSGNEVNLREVLAKYGTDVIGSCAFGVETNSFKYPDAEFRAMGKKYFDRNIIRGLIDVLTIYAPSMMTKFKIRYVPKVVEDFFVRIVMETIEYRNKNNISRNDFLQILIDMKKKDEMFKDSKALTIEEITSQAFLFFAAGFETSSTTASYALYELAKNKKAQNKLREEIDQMLKKANDKITYESILEMPYLNQVIEESLRMYPPLPFFFRVCNKDYKIPNTDVVIEKGTNVIIPVLGIHRDPDIHKDPDQFKPERFSPDNKTRMHQFANIAFGEGPRICIGARFGMMQVRLGLIAILSKYNISVGEKTINKTEFLPKGLLLGPKEDEYLRITERKYTH